MKPGACSRMAPVAAPRTYAIVVTIFRTVAKRRLFEPLNVRPPRLLANTSSLRIGDNNRGHFQKQPNESELRYQTED